MDQCKLLKLLSDLPLGPVHYLSTVDSTNNLAARWAEDGAPDLTLVVADEQTAGRGRLSRRWFTPPGAALAFSLILRKTEQNYLVPNDSISRLTALGAISVCDALEQTFLSTHPAQIKWPNDVLVGRRKLAGVLTEAHWQGDQLQVAILGIGINVAPKSVPSDENLDFPATCLESIAQKTVDRWELLHEVLAKLLHWRILLNSPKLIQAWERRLAFLGEQVQVIFKDKVLFKGQVTGLKSDGSLILRTRSGNVKDLQVGEIRLRPVDSPSE